MALDNILFFDTETTGVPDRSAGWDVDFQGYPHIVQIAWIYGGVEECHIIRPDGWEIPEETTAIHGITQERALDSGEPFGYVIKRFIELALQAEFICGHNIHFDTGIVKANILREIGREWYDECQVEEALFKGKRIDTMRPAMKWVDARMSNGRLKFPNLSELYSRCFPGESFPAHDAMADTKAVRRCLPTLLELGLVELKIKEYNDDAPKNDRNGPVLAAKQKDDKLPNESAKVAQIENSAKISALLEQNDF